MSRAFFSKLLYKRIPQFFSYVFHPLLMPTLGVYIILNSGTYFSLIPPREKRIILLLVASCTLGLPLAFMPFYYYHKIISSFEITQTQERSIPLLITGLLYYLSYILLQQKGIPFIIQAFLLATTITVFVNLLVNLRWKISSHMLGIGGIIGLIMAMSVMYSADVIFYLLIAILLAGFVGFARLSLNAHTPAQVYTGLAAGIVIVMLTLLLF